MYQPVKLCFLILCAIYLNPISLHSNDGEVDAMPYLEQNPRPLSVAGLFISEYEDEATEEVALETATEIEVEIEIVEVLQITRMKSFEHGLSRETYFDVYEYMYQQRIFFPRRSGPQTRAEAYFELAEHMNMGFIKKGYYEYKRQERGATGYVESGIEDFSDLKVELKPQIENMRMRSVIRLNDFNRIDLSADPNEQIISYVFEAPYENVMPTIMTVFFFFPFELPTLWD